ncbi:DUF421 domain-containing protein [Salegentibacter echinorum]|nr:YetF domain-containing protein [Salegentibacter echinorum]
MENWFDASASSLLAILLSSIGIYISIILFTRLFGKRSFSKMSSFDFAMTVAVGSIIASTILSKSVSLIQGVTGLFFIYALQLIAAYFRKYKAFQNLIDNTPLLLMDGKEVLYENLKKARVTESDLKGKLREANVIELKEIRAVIFETTGDISVLHTAYDDKKVDSYILEDVASR